MKMHLPMFIVCEAMLPLVITDCRTRYLFYASWRALFAGCSNERVNIWCTAKTGVTKLDRVSQSLKCYPVERTGQCLEVLKLTCKCVHCLKAETGFNKGVMATTILRTIIYVSTKKMHYAIFIVCEAMLPLVITIYTECKGTHRAVRALFASRGLCICGVLII